MTEKNDTSNGNLEPTSWNIKMTKFARKTENPLRKIWEGPKIKPNEDKKLITLQIGDPTAFGNFSAARESKEAIRRAIDKDKFLYTVSSGMESAREAVAKYVNFNDCRVKVENEDNYSVNNDDIILTSGCSMSLEICFRALANPNENILVPRPAWNYSTWIHGSGINTKEYNLDCTKNWEIDLENLESQIDDNTRALLINNPGNPCGNVFTKRHILDILKIAEKHQLPIIADEVYEFFTFPGVQFYSFSSLSKNVPILSCSGLTKRFIMPGVRIGWIVIHDRNNQFKDEMRRGLLNIAGRNFWPNSTVQLALPEIIEKVPPEFFENNSARVHDHALAAFKILKECPGLVPIFPRGGMYLMTKIELEKFPKFKTCLAFTQELTREQSVATFSGYPCFNFPGFFRIVLTTPKEMIIEACERIKEFCDQHCKNSEKYLKSG